MSENKLFTTLLKKEIRDDDDERSITIWANRSDVVDRSGHVIDDNAWQLDRFLSNPVVCAFHRYDRPPVATAMWARVVPGKGLMMKIKFASTSEGQEFYQLYSENVLNAFSVGFLGKKYIDDEDMTVLELKKYERNGEFPNRVYKEVELFEVSCVAVPDNYASLVAKSANFKSEEVKSIINEIKSSKEYIELTEPTEEKAKKIGFIDLEIKCDNCPHDFVSPIDSVEKADMEDKPQKPCKQEGGECMEDCEEYGTCEDETKKSFEQEEVKNEDTTEDKGISDDSEAGLLDISDNGTREINEIAEEKEVNLDEIESKNEEIIENNVEEKTVKIDISQIKEMVDELKSYINEIVEEKLKFLDENADKVNMEENSEVQEKQVDIIELKEPEKIDFEFKEKTVDVDVNFDPEEIKTMMKSAILNTVSDSKSVEKLVEERIRRMKGIIDFEDE